MTMRGVNLGGWLVLERWMTPSVFEGTDAKDEHSLCSELGAEVKQRITHHRETFITEVEIKQIASLGLNTIRVPVGYWLFGGEDPYADGADVYLDRLFTWAEKYHLQVILSLHGAPGSQNGNDHSGRAGEMNWQQPENVARTLTFLEKLCKRYGSQLSLWGIAVLNEPGWHMPIEPLFYYYANAHEVVRRYCDQSVSVVVSDSFRLNEFSKRLKAMKLSGVVLDTHLYQIYSEADRALDFEGHMKKAQKEWSKQLKKAVGRTPVMVGEWSAIMSELYNPTESHKQDYSNEQYVFYAKAQIETFEKAGVVAWTYWTAKTEGNSRWNVLEHPELLSK